MKNSILNKYLNPLPEIVSKEAEEEEVPAEEPTDAEVTDPESTGDDNTKEKDPTAEEGTDEESLGDEPSSDDPSMGDDSATTDEETEDLREKAREIIEERRRAEAAEREPVDERRPTGFAIPFDEKEQIVGYLEPLIGEDIKELTLVSASELNKPLYHISMNPSIKAFTPQVSSRTLTKENRSIPRISTSTSLIGCMNGYQSVMYDMMNREGKKFNGLFKVYQLPYQFALRPSKKFLPDVDLTDEFWLFSWKRDTYSVTPEVVAEFTVPKIESTFGNNGRDDVYHLYIHVKQDKLYLDRQHVLQEGYYHITLKGYDVNFPLEENDKRLQIEVLDEARYNLVTQLSIMVKKKPSSEYK